MTHPFQRWPSADALLQSFGRILIGRQTRLAAGQRATSLISGASITLARRHRNSAPAVVRQRRRIGAAAAKRSIHSQQSGDRWFGQRRRHHYRRWYDRRWWCLRNNSCGLFRRQSKRGEPLQAGSYTRPNTRTQRTALHQFRRLRSSFLLARAGHRTRSMQRALTFVERAQFAARRTQTSCAGAWRRVAALCRGEHIRVVVALRTAMGGLFVWLWLWCNTKESSITSDCIHSGQIQWRYFPLRYVDDRLVVQFDGRCEPQIGLIIVCIAQIAGGGFLGRCSSEILRGCRWLFLAVRFVVVVVLVGLVTTGTRCGTTFGKRVRPNRQSEDLGRLLQLLVNIGLAGFVCLQNIFSLLIQKPFSTRHRPSTNLNIGN